MKDTAWIPYFVGGALLTHIFFKVLEHFWGAPFLVDGLTGMFYASGFGFHWLYKKMTARKRK